VKQAANLGKPPQTAEAQSEKIGPQSLRAQPLIHPHREHKNKAEEIYNKKVHQIPNNLSKLGPWIPHQSSIG
jgi:hypothetical protein